MSLRWLAAVLAPRDIAPHPNFSGPTDEISVESAVADLLLPSRATLDTKSIDFTTSSTKPLHAEAALGSVRDLISLGKVEQGAVRLSELAMRTSADRDDLGFRAATALLAATGFAEVDRFSDAYQVLDSVLDLAGESMESEVLLIKAACLQQRAFRSFDSEQNGLADARQVPILLRAFNPTNTEPFAVSAGAGWSSGQTLANIAKAIEHAALRLRVQLIDLDDEGWAQLVKSGPPDLLLRNYLYAEGSYEKLVARLYESRGNRGGSLNASMGSFASANESSLWEASMAAECLGHPSARNLREDLALYRLVQESDNEALVQDCLRLLRQAKSRHHASALLHCRAAGPLRALRAEAAQVLDRRLANRTAGKAELLTLRIAADQMSSAEAKRALVLALEQLRTSSPAPGDFAGSSNSWHLEALQLVCSLIRSPSDASLFAKASLDSLIQARGAFDLIDDQYSRLLSSLDWGSLDLAVRQSWSSALIGDLGERFPRVRGVARVGAGITEEKPRSLDWIAEKLNASMDGRDPFTGAEREDAIREIYAQLQVLESQVARGSFAFGGHQPLEVAVAFCLSEEAESLWPAIWRLLTNATVLRPITRAAFERLARSSVEVPPSVRRELEQRVDALLDARQSPIERVVTPYPEVLRFLITSGVIDWDQALPFVALLAFDNASAARFEAAVTITVMLRRGMIPDWAAALAVGLSHDSDNSVQAEAGRALALLVRAGMPIRGMAFARIAELLSAAGTRIPIFILNGVSELKGSEVSAPIRERVEALANSHPSLHVRNAAASVTKKWTGIA